MPRHYDQDGEQGGRRRSRDVRGHRHNRGGFFSQNFTYISSWVKYSMFFFNLLFWLLGFILAGVGIYASFEKWSSGESLKLDNVFDILFNLAFLIVIVGGIIFIVSFAGCIGALRENMCLLQFYSFCLLLFFLAEMTLAALALIFPHKISHYLEGNLSDELIRSYRDDLDFQNLIDLVQQEFQCCGISTAEGFRDWSKNEYFNCTVNPEDNPSVERCGVPFSCCIRGGADDFSEGLVNIMCGFGVQEMSKTEVISKIYTQGCIQRVQAFVEQNLYVVAGIAMGVALLQLLVIWLSRTLESQIIDQRSLWRFS